MPDLKALYSAATAMPPPAAGGAPSVEPPAMPREAKNVNPMTQEGETFFLDPSMLPQGKKCKEGDELLLKVRVGKSGSKIAVTPLEVVDEVEMPGDPDMAGEDTEQGY